MRGLDHEDSARFSFLLATPIILAAGVYKLPDLLGHSNVPHEARHLGAFAVAYGVALMVVVVRPARARSILPVALVLAAAQVITAIVDLATGRIPLVGEAGHVPQIISVVLIWLLAVPSTRRSRAKPKPTSRPHLEVVDRNRRAG